MADDGGRAKKAAHALDEDHRRLYTMAGLVAGGGVVIWALGLGLAVLFGWPMRNWNAVWGLAAVSFLSSSVFPIPGLGAGLLLALSDDFWLGTFGVLGSTIGSTVAAAVLLALGHTGRAYLRRRATGSARKRRFLEWSKKFAKKWTYVGVGLLLVPNFIPKFAVLYAAVLAHLRAVPFLVAVFAGVFVRNLIVLGFLTFMRGKLGL
jgi:membrane protein YqaA with SNARE-associated domain